MPLSRALAAAVVEVVAADPECRRRIDSLLMAVPAGLAGSARNLGMIMGNAAKVAAAGAFLFTTRETTPGRGLAREVQRTYGTKPTSVSMSEAQAQMVCTGIAEASAAAVAAALRKAARGSTLAQVTGADVITRFSPADHDATAVTTAGGWTYVFDWHASLNTRNPWIYPGAKAFEEGRDDEEFRGFTGFG